MRVTLLLCALTLATATNGYAASGEPDPTFGTAGTVVTTFGSSAAASTILRQSDGKLLVAGAAKADAGATSAIAVARYDADGALDPTFGSGGLVTTKVSAGNDGASKVLVQSDGKIVVVGWTNRVGESFAADLVAVRYDTNGALDPTWGVGGIVVTPAPTGSAGGQSAALQADDKVIAVGSLISTGVTGADLLVYRYDTSGALDPSFGTGGVVTLDFGARGDEGRDVRVQPDGYIVVAGTSFNGPLFLDGAVASLTRLDPSGVPDPTFGVGGSVVVSSETIDLFNALAIQGDGSLVAYGARGPGAVSFGLFRYDALGAPDAGFTSFITRPFVTVATPDSLALDAAGRFVTIGDLTTVVRAKPDGTADTTFGSGGLTVITGFGPFARANAAITEPDGDIIVAGSTAIPTKPPLHGFGVTRLQGASTACATDADCGLCEVCASGLCRPGARTGCAVAAAKKAKILVRKGYGKRDLLKLGWKGTVPSFDPTTSDDVAVCLFQSGVRTLKATTPAGGTCGVAPCWSGSPGGKITYADKAQTADGVAKIQIAPTALALKASGVHLTLTTNGVPEWYNMGPQSAPVLAQVQAANGACLEATFGAARKIHPSQMTGRND